VNLFLTPDESQNLFHRLSPDRTRLPPSRRISCPAAALYRRCRHAGLQAYDAAITADTAAGLKPRRQVNHSVALTGTNGVPFEFGASSGEVTIEFILEGNPTATTISAYLAVGETPASSLRYEQYKQYRPVGVYPGGVADYQFNPGVPSPAQPAHVAFVWSPSN